MKQWIAEYFTFNKRERNGVFVLLIIVTLLLLFLSVSDIFLDKRSVDFEELQEYAAVPKFASDSVKHFFSATSSKKIASTPRYKPAPYSSGKQTFTKQNNQPFLIVELNTADTTELKKLRGIGSAFAKRIVKYRDLLGGYAYKTQLQEVYGLDVEKYHEIEPHVRVDTNRLKRINLNEATVENLKSHPYIKWKLANIIIAYRQNHGSFKSVADIKKTEVVSDSIYRRIAPYLTVL